MGATLSLAKACAPARNMLSQRRESMAPFRTRVTEYEGYFVNSAETISGRRLVAFPGHQANAGGRVARRPGKAAARQRRELTK